MSDDVVCKKIGHNILHSVKEMEEAVQSLRPACRDCDERIFRQIEKELDSMKQLAEEMLRNEPGKGFIK